MLSKYDESSRNVIKIETVVGRLVEELGDGGFMNLKDVSEGMKVILSDIDKGIEYRMEVDKVEGEEVYVTAEDDIAGKIDLLGSKAR